MAWMQLAGLGLSGLSAYMGNKQTNDAIAYNNAAAKQQFATNKIITAELLTNLDMKTDRATSEAVRQSIRTKMQVKKAAIAAEGTATVKAAQMGGGSGRRASLALFKPSARVAGDAITDANINLQTELTNLTEHFNDTAQQAIMNLNNAAPILGGEASTTEMLVGVAGAGMNYWSSMSEASKAEVKGLFTSTPDNTLLRNQHLTSGSTDSVGQAAILT